MGMTMRKTILWLIPVVICCSSVLAQQRSLEFVNADASCSRAIVRDNTNKVVPLPAYVKDHLNCDSVSLSPNGRWLTFIKNDHLFWFDFDTNQAQRLSELPENMDGLEVYWAGDSQRFALVLIQQPSAVAKHVAVRIFRTDPQGMAGEQRSYLPVAFDCGSTCIPRNVRWASNLELIYESSINPFSEPVSDPRLLSESLFVGKHDARFSFPLLERLEVALPLSSKSTITLRFQPGQPLELRGPNLQQQFALEAASSEPDIPPGSRATVLMDDFNFDGWLDLAVPKVMDETHGQITYTLHTFNPKQNRFLELRPNGKPLLLDNPTVDSSQRLLMTLTRAGRYGHGQVYKFDRGVLWLYRTRKGEFITGFASDWDLIYEVREFDRNGTLLRRELSEFPSAFKPVLRTTLQDIPIYESPDSLTEVTQLGKGARVRVMALRVVAGVQWMQVQTNTLKGWIK